MDKAEVLAIDRVKALFGADYNATASVLANAAVYLALLEGGDTVPGMSLADYGHHSWCISEFFRQALQPGAVRY